MERLLTLSSKKMPSGRYLKSDPGYIEFNGFDRIRNSDPYNRPGEMDWTISELLKNNQERNRVVRERFEAEVKELAAELEGELKEVEKQDPER